MNLVLDNNNYNINNIYYYDAVKNTVMDDSKFVRIIYSDNNIILNGIYLKLEVEKIMEDNNYIEKLESEILRKYNKKKLVSNKLNDQIQYYIKKYNNAILILKISGIWETDTMIGLTYKLIYDNFLTICRKEL